MANLDLKADVTPVLSNKPADTKPNIADLRAAILGSAVASSYPAAVLDAATKNDLVSIARTHNISVTGL